MKKLKYDIVPFAIVMGAVIIVCIIAFIRGLPSVEIVNKDGIAYIEYLDKTCKLLDENGKQIPFNDTIKSRHNLKVDSLSIGGNDVTIIYDTNTTKYYISILDKDLQSVVQDISIMYDINILEDIQ